MSTNKVVQKEYFFYKPAFFKCCLSVGVLSAILSLAAVKPFDHLLKSLSLASSSAMLCSILIKAAKSEHADLDIFTTPIKLPKAKEKRILNYTAQIKLPESLSDDQEIKSNNTSLYKPLDTPAMIKYRKIPKIKNLPGSEPVTVLQCVYLEDNFIGVKSQTLLVVDKVHDEWLKACFTEPKIIQRGMAINEYPVTRSPLKIKRVK